MVALLLAKKIFELLVYLLIGFILVRSGLLHKEDTKALSILILYVMNPCIMFVAFQMDASPAVWRGLFIGMAAAGVITAVFIGISILWKRFTGGSVEEMGTIVYTNCGNLLIPVVNSVFGTSAIIYLMPYNIMFNLLVWTHGVRLFSGDADFQWKRAFLNINIIAVALGMLSMACGIQISGLPLTIMENLGNMIGPTAMLLTGMVMAGLDGKKLMSYRRLPAITVMRLLICPLVIFMIYLVTGIIGRLPESREVLMIMLLAAGAPAANTVMQFAVLYDADAEYASAINVVSTIACVVTLPFLLWLFEML